MNTFLDTLKRLGPARLAVLGGVAAALLAFFIYLIGRMSQPDMELLYSDLQSQDSSQIVSELDAQNIPYQLSADGSSISVPASEVARMRLAMAEQGLPNGGNMGYEIFDEGESLGTSNFVQNINHVRALEGELARTIQSIGKVKSARVHLVLPQRELFSRDRNEAKASIVLALEGNGWLGKEQVRSIQQLVASSIPRMDPGSVSVIDSQGNLLASTSDDAGAGGLSGSAEERRLSMENRLAQSVQQLLERSVGIGNVRVEVSADINYDRITENSEIYDPDGQVVRSTQVVEEMMQDNEGGQDEVTVGNNLPDADLGGEAADGASSMSNRTEETTNYEISRTTRTHVQEGGDVERLSVAVLVNDVQTTNAEGETVSEPRSQEELDRLAALARSAVGFNPERGDSFEIASMQFADVMPSGGVESDSLLGMERGQLMKIAEVLVLGVIAVLVLLLIVRPLVMRLLTPEGGSSGMQGTPALAGGQQHAALTGPNLQDPNLLASPQGENYGNLPVPGQQSSEEEDEMMLNMSQVEGQIKASTIRKVSDLVDKHPQETLGIIRNWVYQER
ncbi:flagellar basal-body MS-ring/collar protein FliF [Fodinicurvata sediminis]|uniref:flagellar basal-body MS-ring/collar protein FliF n=1 Tax=Fodinicurvata sediminis TaxID=1121832 RepID=UPI0003B6D3EB|nr:flagellar basal-body MS-ring/collar protein FliF [Fodinicurvata sediminis]